MSITSNTLFLSVIAKMNPEIYDALFPEGPEFSASARDIFISMVIKGLPASIIGKRNSEELNRVGRSIFEAGMKSFDWDDNNWCPTYPHVGPIPHPQGDPFTQQGFSFSLNPQPEPPGTPEYYGGIVRQLALGVSNTSHANELRNLASSIAQGAKELVS